MSLQLSQMHELRTQSCDRHRTQTHTHTLIYSLASPLLTSLHFTSLDLTSLHFTHTHTISHTHTYTPTPMSTRTHSRTRGRTELAMTSHIMEGCSKASLKNSGKSPSNRRCLTLVYIGCFSKLGTLPVAGFLLVCLLKTMKASSGWLSSELPLSHVKQGAWCSGDTLLSKQAVA